MSQFSVEFVELHNPRLCSSRRTRIAIHYICSWKRCFCWHQVGILNAQIWYRTENCAFYAELHCWKSSIRTQCKSDQCSFLTYVPSQRWLAFTFDLELDTLVKTDTGNLSVSFVFRSARFVFDLAVGTCVREIDIHRFRKLAGPHERIVQKLLLMSKFSWNCNKLDSEKERIVGNECDLLSLSPQSRSNSTLQSQHVRVRYIA